LVRQAGWRLVACLGLRIDARSYAAGLRDDAPGVKAAALAAAAWCGEQAVLALGRQAADSPSPEVLEHLRFLAVLGGPDELQRIATAGMSRALGPARFDLVASFAHPALVDLLLLAISEVDTDPETAAAAAAAYTRITGVDIGSDHRAPVPPKGGKPRDDVDAEFDDEVVLPDYPRAYHHWQTAKAQFAGATRVCRGLDVSRGLTVEQFGALDMQSRRELSLRGRFLGTWPGSPMHLEIFPQGQ
jgi:hypothetical protein